MVQTISGFYGQVSDADEARRFHRVSPPRVLWYTSAFSFGATSAAGRVITLAPGSVLCCGIRMAQDANTTVTMTANSSGSSRYDYIGLRFDWTAKTVTLFTKTGTASNVPALTRTPGVLYEMPLYVVLVRNGISTIAAADIMDARIWGGLGGAPWQMNPAPLLLQVVDLPLGSYVQIGANKYQVWTVDGLGNITFLLVSSQNTIWTNYTPTMRDGSYNPVTLGVGSYARGWYLIKDGYCHVRIEIQSGSAPFNFGVGQLNIDLPPGVIPSDKVTDQWGDGQLFTTVGDGAYRWPIKGMMRKDYGGRILLYANPTAGDPRLLPQASANFANSGYGTPLILPNGTYTAPNNIDFTAKLLIA
jgi:hypothetical protein